MRYQHNQGRAFIRQIDGALPGYADGDVHAIEAIRENATAYVSMLRHHIHTEDNVFFPMAQRVLSGDDIREIRAEFDRERRLAGPDAFERYHKIAVDLRGMLEALP